MSSVAASPNKDVARSVKSDVTGMEELTERSILSTRSRPQHCRTLCHQTCNNIDRK